jgi:hypothetical protein
MSSRKRQSPTLWKKYPGPRNLTLPLPFEIRDQILTHLLVSKQEVLDLMPGLWPLCHCGNEYIRAAIRGTVRPHINNLGLSKQFRILTQVSRKLRADAINILFYRNKWHLTMSLSRDEPNGGHSFIDWDSSAMVRKLWGLDAILSIRYMKITVENEKENARRRIKSYFHTFVKIVRLSQNLRRLEVEWLNYESLDSDVMASRYWSGGSKRNHHKEEIRGVSRKADGTRESTKHFRGGVSRWGEGQTILKALEDLRGIPEAIVTECVTDKWAEHLEKCMKSERQTCL